MKKLILLFGLFVHALSSHSQDNPKIGSTEGLKEKFLLIKKGLPNIKKNLTKADPTLNGHPGVSFEMGGGYVLFEEDEKKTETLTIGFSESFFSGSLDDFKTFYKKLVGIVTDVFSSTHEPIKENTDTYWATSFLEKKKDVVSTKSYINIQLTWEEEIPDIVVTVTRMK